MCFIDEDQSHSGIFHRLKGLNNFKNPKTEAACRLNRWL